MDNKRLMLGNEAIARGAYEAGVRVCSSYPGTPSTEITEYISKYDNLHAEWAPNEKVALEVAIGASIAGVRSMACMKHVGLNVAADPLFTASYVGVNGGLVLCVADDPGMHSSQNEQDTRRIAAAAKVPCLEPSDSEECRVFMKAAFELSEAYDTPVIVRLSTRVSHSQGLVSIEEPINITPKDYKKDIPKYVAMPAFARKRHEIVEQNIAKLAAESFMLNRIEWSESGGNSVGVITSGVAYNYAREAFGDVSFLKLGMTFPLQKELIEQFASKVKTLYIIEELEPVIEEYCKTLGLQVIGKDRLPICGEYSAELLRDKLINSDNSKLETRSLQLAAPNRPPVMCPGCPHRGVHYILSKLKKTVAGDIGCYTLGALPPHGSIDICLCMGASVGMAHGIAKAAASINPKDTVALIGDSTFIHSGITGLIGAVYNQSNVTLIIVDNSTTGMTGHQDNPATGKTLKGDIAPMLDLVGLCKAIGVKRVSTVDPFELPQLETIIKEENVADEPSVIIVKRPCALIIKDKSAKPLCVNKEMCIGCKLCMKLGCPAIAYIEDEKRVEINAGMCVGCGLCAKLCKKKAIE